MRSNTWITVLIGGFAVLAGIFIIGRLAMSPAMVEAKAKTLVGQPESKIESVLGKPDQIFDSNVFNQKERDDIVVSFRPRHVPYAQGPVFMYDHFPTIILLFSDGEVITEIYVGKS